MQRSETNTKINSSFAFFDSQKNLGDGALDYALKLLSTNPKFTQFIIANHDNADVQALNKAASERLKNIGGYPSECIVSVNKDEICFPLMLLKGTLHYEEYRKNQQQSDLDIACEMGVYRALAARIILGIEKLKTNKPDEIKIADVIDINQDIRRIANLYWWTGHIATIKPLRELSVLCDDIPGQQDAMNLFIENNLRQSRDPKQKEQNDDAKPLMFRCLEAIIKNYYLSIKLEEMPQSKTIKETIRPAENYYKNLSELKEKMKTMLKICQIPPESYFDKVAATVDDEIKKINEKHQANKTANEYKTTL